MPQVPASLDSPAFPLRAEDRERRKFPKAHGGLLLVAAALLAALATNSPAEEPAWELYSINGLKEQFSYDPGSIASTSGTTFRVRERIDSTDNPMTDAREMVFVSEVDCVNMRSRTLEIRTGYKDGRMTGSAEPTEWGKIAPILWDGLYGKWCVKLLSGESIP